MPLPRLFTVPENAWPLLKYIHLPGIALVIAGGGASLLTGQWTVLYQSLMAIGVVCLAIWWWGLLRVNTAWATRRSTRAGASAFVVTTALLVILVALNLFAFRYSYTLDLSENQRFTLAPQTQTLVARLDKPIKVWIFDSQPAEGDRALLKNYQQYNPQFTYEFIDPDQNPALVQKFGVKAQGEVWVEYGGKKQSVQTLINYQQREPLSEIKLTNALEKLRIDRPLSAYFLQGHGESPLTTAKEGLSEAVTALQNKGFQVNPLNLIDKGTIPTNSNVVIVAGPQRKLLEAEVKALTNYSQQGGNILVMVGPEVETGLEPLLSPWGVSLDPRIVVDLSGAGAMVGLGPAAPLINQYGEHPITADFAQGLSILPLSRPIATRSVPNVQAVALLAASEKMVAKRELTEDLAPNPQEDLAAPFDLAVALERTASSNANPPEPADPQPSATPSPQKTSQRLPNPKVQLVSYSWAQNAPLPTPAPTPSPTPSGVTLQPAKLVVIGNSLFATNEWFNEQLNGDLFLNSVQWLAHENQDPLSLRPKDPTNRRLNLTPLQASLLGWVSWIVVPLLGLVLAVFTWWRQR